MNTVMCLMMVVTVVVANMECMACVRYGSRIMRRYAWMWIGVQTLFGAAGVAALMLGAIP